MFKCKILIHLDGGIGDIVMGTPCVNALVKAGHEVDVYIRGDVYKPIELFQDWRGPAHVSSIREDFVENIYDFYLMGSWVWKPLELKNTARTVIMHAHYTSAFANFGSQADLMLQYAKAIDPVVDLNAAAYCGRSRRIFPEISRDTVVLYSGCKKEYPMKRWDKFDELADQFTDVAVVGTKDDLWLGNSVSFSPVISQFLEEFLKYNGKVTRLARAFGKKYNHQQNFSKHVKNYIGQLSLADTASLISQAGMFIGNDGGLSSIAGALKVPTFVLSGPTDPRYWNIKGSCMNNISKNLDCQPCMHWGGKHAKAWKYNYIGCPIGMKCMTDLTVQDVLTHVKQKTEKKQGCLV